MFCFVFILRPVLRVLEEHLLARHVIQQELKPEERVVALIWRPSNNFLRYIQRPVSIQVVLVNRPRRDGEISDACLRAREKPRRAGDAGETEHVLVFEIRAVGVAIDLQRDDILAGLDELRDVELGGIARILREADVLAVDPEVEERIDGVELEEDFLSAPLLRHVEVAAVGADGIARGVGGPVLRRFAHDVRLVALEGIRLVHIECRAPPAISVRAIRLPRARHLDRLPR